MLWRVDSREKGCKTAGRGGCFGKEGQAWPFREQRPKWQERASQGEISQGPEPKASANVKTLTWK